MTKYILRWWGDTRVWVRRRVEDGAVWLLGRCGWEVVVWEESLGVMELQR